jgi:uncharacterized coiled-coil protein SlyX
MTQLENDLAERIGELEQLVEIQEQTITIMQTTITAAQAAIESYKSLGTVLLKELEEIKA